MIQALLLSNSTMPGTPFFTWPKPHVRAFLGDMSKELVFIPFAAVSFSFDEYEEKVAEAFSTIGYKIKSIHRYGDKQAALKEAGAIVVGGGNTFALLQRMYSEQLLETTRSLVLTGTPYVGWSAGANLGCPTIMTTNDMPVVQPPSFNALNLVPFQINPHYHELKFEGQGGETRKDRLEEFLVMNPSRKVIGLPEGMFIKRMGEAFEVGGNGVAKLYKFGKEVEDVYPGKLILSVEGKNR
jgi:dipeptidase E